MCIIPIVDHAEHYHFAHTCLHYGFYTECIDHCDHIIAAATTSLHGVARQVRGKAYMHIYTKISFGIL